MIPDLGAVKWRLRHFVNEKFWFTSLLVIDKASEMVRFGVYSREKWCVPFAVLYRTKI